jgi:hypothetical protein
MADINITNVQPGTKVDIMYAVELDGHTDLWTRENVTFERWLGKQMPKPTALISYEQGGNTFVRHVPLGQVLQMRPHGV